MRIAFKNFTGGEVSPTLTGRYDIERYATSVACMQNMLPGLHGDAARRPGTRFVADLGAYSVLIPFSFNAESAQNFVIILSDKALRVSDGVSSLSEVIASPYSAQDILRISWAQVGDIIYLAHPAYSLHKIMRENVPPEPEAPPEPTAPTTESSGTGSYDGYVWRIAPVVLNESIAAPGTPSVSFHGEGGGFTLRYKVVAVDSQGRESLPSPTGAVGGGRHPSDWVQGNSVSISWAAVPNADEYNIYREEAGYYGFIGISRGLSFSDQNYEADVTDTPREDWNPFADNNNPGVVAFHQQRMVLANTPKSPQAFYMSRTGDFENFRKSRPLQDDDPVEYLIASGSIDAVTWAAGFGDLLLGTSGSEYKASGDGGVITTKNITITAQSYWGSAGLTPLIIGNSILHVQRHGSRVRDLFYSLEKDGYAGNDLSIMAPHLFDGHTLVQWAYQQTPGSHIWCVRDDGALLVLTYLKEHKISGWSRQITDGRVISAASVSGQNGDVILLAVEREIAGEKRVMLERLADPFAPDAHIAEAYFVDCGISTHSDEATTEVTGLGHLEGRTLSVLADGSPVEGLVVTGGRIELPYPARVVHAGLPYVSELTPLPVEADTQAGSTLGKRRAYGRCMARLFRSVGGKYGAVGATLNDFPFLPTTYGEPCEPFSGDIDFTPGGGQRADASVRLVQDRPLPWHLVALVCDVDFGEA